MEVFFDLPNIGELTLEHSFYLLDNSPILFVCTDDIGARYLCSCFQMDEGWVICRVDESTLLDLIDDKLTIREVFEKQHQSNWVVSWNGEEFHMVQDVAEDVFPVEGAYLELAYEKNGEYKECLKEGVHDIKSKVRINTDRNNAPVWKENLDGFDLTMDRLFVKCLPERENEKQTASLSDIFAIAA